MRQGSPHPTPATDKWRNRGSTGWSSVQRQARSRDRFGVSPGSRVAVNDVALTGGPIGPTRGGVVDPARPGGLLPSASVLLESGPGVSSRRLRAYGGVRLKITHALADWLAHIAAGLQS